MVRLRHRPISSMPGFRLRRPALLRRIRIRPVIAVASSASSVRCRALRLARGRRPALAGREVIPRRPLARRALRSAGHGRVVACVLPGCLGRRRVRGGLGRHGGLGGEIGGSRNVGGGTVAVLARGRIGGEGAG
jgi:hypothetical protein